MTTSKRFKQGYYTPTHPEKYVGDLNKIIYRSSYELEMNQFLDNNPNVLKWSSETVVIPYVKPTDGRIHRYFVDYFVEYVNKDGEIITELIEVKPRSQTTQPRKNSKSHLYEQLQFAVNMAKWEQAKKYAESRGWKFRVITERKIFR